MKVILNGKEAKNVDVLKFYDKKSMYIDYEIRNKKGKRWSLIRNRKNPNLLGVVNHGSINNHKFRGYEWFTDSVEGTLLGLVGAY